MPKNDDNIWATYAKSVKPVGKKPRRSSAATKTNSYPSRKGKGIASAEAPTLLPDVKNFMAPKERQTLFDRKTERTLREGDIAIEGKLDLHGMTQTEAHAALLRFLEKQMKAGNRNLLVITGKGTGKKGVLRNNLPEWLEALPLAHRIRMLRPASLKHGGDGAFYLILKRS